MLNAFFNQEANGILEQRDFFKCYIRDGRFYLSDLDQPGYVYLSTIEEFRAKFAVAGFIQLVLACVESFANYDQTSLLKANPENTEVWLDLSEQMGSTPERLGMTGHFLYV